ncbi:glucokinase [Beijerinckia indica subsp. indica ATCC 9039]|uniref:Glucokinase n=1 Tax=Beijerinckia indica subsp. indica (strain ATCC 9039 / DSM 1715 / NCIMB 8712) TaxID=395963 RepID=B2IDS0_BEII9|nr:glucokinase [Beijerinckia indica subsp. indica ATCC 9039]
MEIVAVDIGGTHARFALAEVADGRVVHLGEAVTLQAAEHGSFQLAWETFAQIAGRALPRAVAIAIACPVGGEVLKLTNNPWIIRPALIPEKLHVDAWTLVNDFGAIAHTVAQVGEDQLMPITGPDHALPQDGVISIVGPGTGLGVGHVLRRGGHYHVIECEGGHIDFAPLDSLEDQILKYMRHRYPRVSVERLISGPGLVNIYEALAAIEGKSLDPIGDKELWAAAMAGKDSLAAAALDRFCLSLGAVCGDIALALGAKSVVIAGGLGLRIASLLPQSGFATRFTAKGRFAPMMATIPVRCIIHPQPGLYGAAAAFAVEH